jgi:hypothetical protein
VGMGMEEGEGMGFLGPWIFNYLLIHSFVAFLFE